jgi:NgoMIV restriction enzyme
MNVAVLRKNFHKRICEEIIRDRKDKKGNKYLNLADSGNRSSRLIAHGVVDRIGFSIGEGVLKEQTTGGRFETITMDFIQNVFEQLQHIRPGEWEYKTAQTGISGFDQYSHLAYLAKVISKDKELSSTIGGDYIVKPDIVISRQPLSDDEINTDNKILNGEISLAQFTPLRQANHDQIFPMLHASVSCKWTIRSDRSQNTRTEALNLIRNRKGHLPHVVAVTAEPLPTRIAALALGTGDLDCVYHFALPELLKTLEDIDNQDQLDMLNMMVDGRRLRDISDLPFDLAI